MIRKSTMDKFIIIVSILIMIAAIIFVAESQSRLRGAEIDMYAEIYDRDGNHITNVIIDKYSITRRVFDFDTSSFEGVSDVDISDGITFVFKDNVGNYEYSGFAKNITQDEDTGYVKFKGDDLRKIFDTEITLDYSQEDYVTQTEDTFSLHNIFTDVYDEVIQQSSITVDEGIIPVDDRLTQFIANYSGQKITVNAWTFLKVYCGYYNYYVSVKVSDLNANELVVEFINQSDTAEIKLNDFTFDKTTSEVSTTHAVATIAQPSNLKDSTSNVPKIWVYSSEELYNATPTALQLDYDYPNITDYATWGPINFEDSFSDREEDVSIRVRLWAGAQVGEPDRIFYMQPVTNYTAYATDVVKVEYWLGLDNEIYYQAVPSDKEIIPAKTKIYEEEYLTASQYNAIWELVNSRYIEYIILTSVTDMEPLDITTLSLYEFITVYDSNGVSKVLPVSEITYTQDSYKVKLGFKKILLTEIIKGGATR